MSCDIAACVECRITGWVLNGSEKEYGENYRKWLEDGGPKPAEPAKCPRCNGEGWLCVTHGVIRPACEVEDAQ